jgi:hypothetical protein
MEAPEAPQAHKTPDACRRAPASSAAALAAARPRPRSCPPPPPAPPRTISTHACGSCPLGSSSAITTTASGSASPDAAAVLKPRRRLPVAKYTGSATATPSGMLCNAMAMASDSDVDTDLWEVR